MWLSNYYINLSYGRTYVEYKVYTIYIYMATSLIVTCRVKAVFYQGTPCTKEMWRLIMGSA